MLCDLPDSTSVALSTGRDKWLYEKEKYNSDVKLLKELRINGYDDYKNYLRMDANTFDDPLHRLEPYLKRKNAVMRDSIPLRFLATGRNYEDLKFNTGISPQALGYIIPETCRVIYEVLKGEFLKFPSTTEEWKQIANGFEQKWQISNCVGAMDGKHIRIWAPPRTGAQYYNYKHSYSIVLMAVVNSNYEFIFVDAGKNGRISDGGVLQYTTFYQYLVEEKLHLPDRYDCRENMNFVFISDEAFALHKHILKPFPQRNLNYEKRIYNYRLSKGRNVVENVFGLITARFRVLHTTINMKPLHIQYVVLAICTLHNYLIQRKNQYIGPITFDSENKQTHQCMKNAEWRQNDVQLCPLQISNRNGQVLDAKENRLEYMKYFTGNGKVTWQDEMLNAGKS
ncbi:uncharacterized protein LOC111692317 [Anoplophora glabripennis]|uniref:uncharacterized protein LOC111692317 n=1 Tax=Anoplophora glabripennis TaxID=217634 RepID=UPI000C780679|nr:uncharacterized protein LOC111692317 [Anoplophora glabripennis]